MKRLELKSNEKKNNDIKNMCMVIKDSMTLTYLKEEDLVKLLWELINRVVNATIGNKVRKYRCQSLLRLNTVAFRTELVVTSEHM